MALTLLVVAVIYLLEEKQKKLTSVEVLKEKHSRFLINSPFKDTKKMSRDDRKAMGLPPNAYHEQMWELTMDPSTGRPMPELVMQLQRDLRAQRELARGVGGVGVNPWISRGPNNQGGRTRGIMFDPNDVGNADPSEDYNRVFAGGVSGGLWVNEDITDENESWTLVPGIQENISVTVIVADPNDSNVFYIGSGESYVSGDAVGRGIWKSEDAGATWQLIFGNGITSITGNGQSVNGIFYVNDIVIRDFNGTSEVYAAISSAFYRTSSSPGNFNGLFTMGLYKSINGGDSWNRFNIVDSETNTFKNPNDIELDINNNIWVTTTRSPFGVAGGDIYKSTNGVTFDSIYTIANARRTELEVSATDANDFWVVADRGEADIFKTEDAFNTVTRLNEPDDADEGIPAEDYTRGQAFYNLPIEANSSGKLFIGGIDLFSTEDDGINWQQLSKWTDRTPGLTDLSVPLVHADQHAIVFRPGTNDTEAIFANDGGVYYTDNINNALNNPNAIQSRNKDYITTQFYYGTISSGNTADGDDLAGGTQDNGTQLLVDGAAGENAFFDPYGGDGGYADFNETGTYLIQSYTRNTHSFVEFPQLTNFAFLTEQPGGNFINTAALDKSLDILYSYSTIDNDVSLVNQIERVSNFLPNDDRDTVNEVLVNSLLNATATAMKVSPFTVNQTKLFVGLANGNLLKIDSASTSSATWSNIADSNFIGSISDIEFGQSEDEIFVTMHNYGVISVWFTNNGGSTWRSLEGNLPELPVKCILQNPLIPQELIIGTELGVWATADYTADNPVWVQAFNGMSDVTVLDLDLRESDNTILASSYGRGLFTSQFTAQPLSVLGNTINKDVVTLFPTVSDGHITVKSSKQFSAAKVEVFSLTGQRVFMDDINLSKAGTDILIDAQPGIYLATLSEGNFSETKKIIIR